MRLRDRLPRSSRSWACPYFRTIILCLAVGFVFGVVGDIHYNVQIACMLIIVFLLGITIGSRRLGETCEA